MSERERATDDTTTGASAAPIRVLCVGPDGERLDRTADGLVRGATRLSTSTATDFEGVSEALETGRVDCVVSDHRRPEFDGVALLERVRSIDESLPVVLFTAHGDETTASAVNAGNVSGYVSETGESSQYAALSDRIENVVDKHRRGLRLSERKSGFELAETLFNNTQDALFIVDVSDEPFRLERVNPTYECLSGLSNEELRGRTLTDAVGEQDGGAILERYHACVEAREPLEYEEEVSLPSSGPYWETRISPVIVDDRVEKLVGATRNITERKREQQELERTGEFLSQIQRVAGIGGWELDERTETVRWTAELHRIHGLPPEYEPTVAEAIDFCHPADRERVQTAYERLSSEGDPFDLELRLKTDDGERRWVRSRGEPWHDGGDRVGARGTVQDITERKEREAALERTNDRLDEFASVVSHDLRNPLVVAQGSLSLYHESGAEADFERVVAAHERIEALINDLLSLAREGQQVTERTTVALGQQVASAFGLVPGDDATLDIAVGEYTLRADKARLGQMLDNLLGNAVRHGGADVTVRVGLLDDDAGFYVADDGPGIPPPLRDQVFEHGYSTGTEGTGLGLAIVRGIAAAHGWQVGVTDSTLGGARFEVRTE
ncbi:MULTISPECIES: PAS domain S-box protein [Haloarcula]|uniref:PAS domain S-box protein n=1 Tax=Haloarcula TaxID=2237 RepID=UPI0023E8AD70|nr:PAS domain S-box protein [Halomicroarcula sp. SHR3]